MFSQVAFDAAARPVADLRRMRGPQVKAKSTEEEEEFSLKAAPTYGSSRPNSLALDFSKWFGQQQQPTAVATSPTSTKQ